MTKPFVLRFLLVVLSAKLGLYLYANQTVSGSNTGDKPAAPEASDKPASAVHLVPGPIDGRIATVTANFLERGHYSGQKFDRAVSARFFDRYLETLDSQHSQFLQSDLAQFDLYRTNLSELTMNGRGFADTRPACEIFNRFMERLQQRVDYVEGLLKTEKFTFDADERITVNRHELPYPKDLEEAKKLWRERLRYEYLQEKLGKAGAKKKAEASAAKKPIEPPQTIPPANPADLRTPPEKKSDGNQSKYDAAKLAKLTNAAAPGKDTASQAQAREALRKASPLDAVPKIQPEPTAALKSLEPDVQPLIADAPALVLLKKTEAEEIAETLGRRYHRNLRMFKDWNSDDVLQVYLTTLAHVYDPHSDYFGHSQLDSFSIGMNLSLSGIGAELQLSDDGYCTIRKLLPGGPAEKSKKIKVKDRIVAVAQGDQTPVDIIEMSLTKAVQLIRGPKATEVRLTVIPADADASARKVISLVRDDIKLEEQEAKSKVIDLPDGRGKTLRIGVIGLPSFYASFDLGGNKRREQAETAPAPVIKSTTADVSRLLQKLKAENVQGVILDLRNNGGGSLEEAIKLTGLFIKEGPVVQVKNGQGDVEVDNDPDPSVLYEGPLIVLTSRLSASASEIVAGALQDYGRALVVGDASTHGKGTVQSVNDLRPHLQLKGVTNEPGALKLTIKKFYRVSGGSTQLKGVVPDIVLPSVFNEVKEFGEASLENPMPWDTNNVAKYERLNLVEPYLAELRKRSAQRVAAEKDFDYVREDIELFKKQQADKTMSLNEKQRLKEKEEAEARQKARDKERLARAEPPEKVYELTLRQVDLPGLPPPVQKTNAALAKVSLNSATAAVSTNSAAAATKASLNETSPGEEAEEEKPPAVDVTLAEAEHILVDYLSVFPKHDVAATIHRAEKAD